MNTESPFFVHPPRLNRSDSRALWLNLALAIALVLLVNGLIFAFGWNTDRDPARRSTAWEIPGAIVGRVWVGLFAGLAVARWRLNRPAFTNPVAGIARWWIGVLGLNCLAYPLHSLAIGSIYGGLAGNVLTMLLAGWVARLVWPHDRPAAGLVGLIVVWVALATVTIFGQLGWLG